MIKQVNRTLIKNFLIQTLCQRSISYSRVLMVQEDKKSGVVDELANIVEKKRGEDGVLKNIFKKMISNSNFAAIEDSAKDSLRQLPNSPFGEFAKRLLSYPWLQYLGGPESHQITVKEGVAPVVDSNNEFFRLTVELPGFLAEDISVMLREEILYVIARKATSESEKTSGYLFQYIIPKGVHPKEVMAIINKEGTMVIVAIKNKDLIKYE